MRTNSARAHKSEEGKVMILALVLLVIGTLLLTPLLGFMSTGLTAGHVYERKTAELYAADAGVMDAIWKIQTGNITAPPGCYDPDDWPYRYDITGLINDRNVNVEVDYVDHDTFRITSNATDENGSGTTIESYVSYGSEWGELLNFGLIALDGDIVIGGDSVLGGSPEGTLCHIYADGDIRIGGSEEPLIKVPGSARATGTVTGKDRVSPGPARGGVEELVFAEPDIDRYLDEAKTEVVETDVHFTQGDPPLGPVHIMGDLTIAGGAEVTLGGPVWVEGNVDAVGGAVIDGKGPIVAEGEIKLAGGSDEAPEEIPLIVSRSTNKDAIQPTGDATIFAVLYAPKSEIRIRGDASINGAIIAKAIDIRTSGHTRVSYDLDVVDRVRVPGLKIHTWEIK